MDFCTDYTKMFHNIVKHGTLYIKRYPKIQSLVLGLSGGIDSAATAAIAREICDEVGIRLIGVSIPIETNTKAEVRRAKQVGEAFCHEFIEMKYIDRLYRFSKLMIEMFWYSRRFFRMPGEKIRQGNIKARLRMMCLYDKAHRSDGIVLSTDNLSEYYLNFFTLHGDVGDLGLVQNIWKTELYNIVDKLINHYYRENMANRGRALLDCYQAVPTDGLGITASDFQQIGVDNYLEADEIMIKETEAAAGFKMPDGHDEHPVVQRCRRYAFKRHNPFNIARELIVPGNATVIDNL